MLISVLCRIGYLFAESKDRYSVGTDGRADNRTDIADIDFLARNLLLNHLFDFFRFLSAVRVCNVNALIFGIDDGFF